MSTLEGILNHNCTITISVPNWTSRVLRRISLEIMTKRNQFCLKMCRSWTRETSELVSCMILKIKNKRIFWIMYRGLYQNHLSSNNVNDNFLSSSLGSLFHSVLELYIFYDKDCCVLELSSKFASLVTPCAYHRKAFIFVFLLWALNQSS